MLARNVRDGGRSESVFELREIETAREYGRAGRLDHSGLRRLVPVTRLEFSDTADGVVLGRRRLLHDERPARAVPENLLRSRPAVAGSRPLPILRADLVIVGDV